MSDKRGLNRLAGWHFPAVFILMGILSAVLSGCMSLFGEREYYHTISFNVMTDAKVYGKPDVELLYWVYGDGSNIYTKTSDSALHTGDTEKQTNDTMKMARGKTLYVKWRELANGAVHEDRVDLDKRMPKNIEDCRIHFIAEGSQLYVFFFPPKYSHYAYLDWRPLSFRKEFQIYPDIK